MAQLRPMASSTPKLTAVAAMAEAEQMVGGAIVSSGSYLARCA